MVNMHSTVPVLCNWTKLYCLTAEHDVFHNHWLLLHGGAGKQCAHRKALLVGSYLTAALAMQ